MLRGSFFYAAACRCQFQAAQQETVCNTPETASKRVSLLSSGGIKGETVSDLGKVHMDALRDKQPDFVDVNTHMSIPCYPGQAQTQEPAAGHASSASLVINSCYTRHIQTTLHSPFG